MTVEDYSGYERLRRSADRRRDLATYVDHLENLAHAGRQLARQLHDLDPDSPAEQSPMFKGRCIPWLRSKSNHNAGVWPRLRGLLHPFIESELSDEELAQAAVQVAMFLAEDLWFASEKAERRLGEMDRWKRAAKAAERELAQRSKKAPRGTRRITPKMRAKVYARDDHKCLACESTENLSIDHIIPFSQGGACHVDNFQTLCRSCNSRKNATFIDLGVAA